jgi:hypothetical protein
MKKSVLLSVSALVFAGSVALAEVPVDAPAATPVEMQISMLDTQGYKRIEVKTGLTQTKIEAINPETREKLELVIDSATGEILSQETGMAGLLENTAEGIFYRTRNRNFVDADDEGSSDDNSDDDNGDDTSDSSSDDSGSDDDGSDDRGSDSNDDSGSSDSNS